MSIDLVKTVPESVRDDSNTMDLIELGQWYWVSNLHTRSKPDDFNVVDERIIQAARALEDGDEEEAEEEPNEAPELEDEDEDEEDEEKPEHPPTKWLACVTEVGTNYAELTAPNGMHQRIHFDTWDKWCVREDMPEAYTKRKVAQHSAVVAELLDEVRHITHLLGVVPRKEIDSVGMESQTALATAHGTADIKAHQLALVNAKEELLPELFKRVKNEHELMATWMKADLVPMRASLEQMKKSVSVIDDRIFTVQLYAGLVEQLKQVKRGKPAADDAKVHVFQRRHYMDEECLARYQAGGMEFNDIRDFDKWICRPENFSRILPFDRSVVAFRVRRNMKERNHLDAFIKVELEKADKLTFLYIRNGNQCWRLSTEIDFGAELFPDHDSHELLASKEVLYANVYWDIKAANIITESRYLGLKHAHEEHEKEKNRYTKWWEGLTKEQQAAEKKRDGSRAEPWFRFHSDSWDSQRWHRVDKDTVYYDDVMREIARMSIEHNRVATVLQGLLDRAECFLPHPPWKIWTQEGFAAGMELVYDNANTLTPGDAPDFETYRHRLNMSLKLGCLTIGQEDMWLRAEAVKYNAQAAKHYDRYRHGYGEDRTWHRPYNNPGPGYINKAVRAKGDTFTFTWMRSRERTKYVPHPTNTWKRVADESEIEDSIVVPASKLFNVSAYTPGDFHMFYDDPRTRAKYLQWAPFLLAAEDYHASAKPDMRALNGTHHVLLGDATKEEETDE